MSEEYYYVLLNNYSHESNRLFASENEIINLKEVPEKRFGLKRDPAIIRPDKFKDWLQNDFFPKLIKAKLISTLTELSSHMLYEFLSTYTIYKTNLRGKLLKLEGEEKQRADLSILLAFRHNLLLHEVNRLYPERPKDWAFIGTSIDEGKKFLIRKICSEIQDFEKYKVGAVFKTKTSFILKHIIKHFPEAFVEQINYNLVYCFFTTSEEDLAAFKLFFGDDIEIDDFTEHLSLIEYANNYIQETLKQFENRLG